jgi:tRNA-dihydrouridine synthase A
MAEPELVAQCVCAMRDAVSIPISVKHRLGLNSMDQSIESDYQFAFNFMYKAAEAGAMQLTIHAEKCCSQRLIPERK